MDLRLAEDPVWDEAREANLIMIYAGSAIWPEILTVTKMRCY